ncbi:ABC transporter ATP-binding protein [Agromyces silvae]|uniref:ABC transporter ATP-binding protein n=1 Tax=Agromyces silvae TaxID=3388266 RepID=UPI00280A8ECA|nr:ABC transporter ATP-binding protein [Agromyces protaetiae]
MGAHLHDEPELDGDTPVLEIVGLTVDLPTQAGPVRVLDGVNLSIGRGEIVGVAGESGSGKSMTAMSVLGLLPPRARLNGSIRFAGEELTQLSAAAMRAIRGRRIGMVFQDPMTTLNPLMRVGEQIAEAYAIHHPREGRRRAKQRALDMLGLVGVPDTAARAEQYPHQWSGGMRQRAVIAMALVNDPELLIADESTTALDATIQAQVLDVLTRARAELGISVLFITHDLGLIAQIAGRTIVMYAGRVMETASTEAVFANSHHPYTRALMASRPGATPPGARLPTIPGRPPAPGSVGDGCPFAPRCSFPLKDERCRSERPPLRSSADGRLSACHFRNQYAEGTFQ